MFSFVISILFKEIMYFIRSKFPDLHAECNIVSLIIFIVILWILSSEYHKNYSFEIWFKDNKNG